MADRFTRQRRLAEVGERGQERIQNAVVRVAATPDGVVAALYLSRAGVQRIELSATGEAPEFTHATSFRHAASRQIGEGSWRALAAIVGVLEKAEA
jgi:molybdopterin/thiamine biosynthesis adenylyltransferase